MNQRHLYRLAVGCQRSLQPAPMRGSLSKAKPALAPEDASDLLDEVLLGRALRTVLGHQRLDNGPVFVGTLPGQHRLARQHAVAQRVEAAVMSVPPVSARKVCVPRLSRLSPDASEI
jgi:hypothetical protein